MNLPSFWEFPMMLLMLIVASTITQVSQAGIEANAEHLSLELFRNISHAIAEDTLAKMKKELLDIKGTMREELELVKEEQEQLKQILLSIYQSVSLLSNRTSPLCTTIHGDAHSTASTNSPTICSDVPSAETKYLHKAFYRAASDGDISFINAKIAKLDNNCLDLDWRNPDEFDNTPLLIAIKNDHPTIGAALLEAGAYPDMQDQLGQSPVYLAAGRNHIRVLSLLLDHSHQADVNLPTQYGRTPVYHAVDMGKTEALELLLQKGGDPNKAYMLGSSPLMKASEEGNLEAMRLLIQAGANLKQGNVDGITALHVAAINNQPEAARLLLQSGIDKNIRDNFGATPADDSRKHGDGSVARLIENY